MVMTDYSGVITFYGYPEIGAQRAKISKWKVKRARLGGGLSFILNKLGQPDQQEEYADRVDD